MGQLSSAETQACQGVRTGFKADISRILKYAPEKLIGRDDESKLLSDAWMNVRRAELPRAHVLTFVALGGEGKTSLVAKWAAGLAGQDWPDCDAAFAWSFYSQGTREHLAASSDLFLKAALTFFGDDADKEFAASSSGAFEKGQRLAHLVGQRRSFLILDGLEPLQYAPTAPTPGELKDQGIAALLKGLATASLGLCVVTTRYLLPDLKAFWQTTAPEVKLLRLSCDASVHLLKTLGVNGTAKEFEKLVEDVKGHALTLTLLGGFLQRAFHGDIRQRDRVKFEKADEKMDGGHAFRTMAAYEQWLLRDGGNEGRREVAVLRLMGLFDQPADADCLAALRSKTIPGLTEPLAGLADDDWEYCLSGLETAKLLTVNRDAAGALVSLDAHPLIREYFAAQLKGSARASRAVSGALAGNTDADIAAPLDQPAGARVGAREGACAPQTSEAWRAAHRRLYEHLCKTTKEGDKPALEDLQPLYQAVVHGCQAGLYDEALNKVLIPRIRRDRCMPYSFYCLGTVGSDLSAFFNFLKADPDYCFQKLNDGDQAYVLNETGGCLRAAGRPSEAITFIEESLRIREKLEDWEGCTRSVHNLTGALIAVGRLDDAVNTAQMAISFAEQSNDPFDKYANHCWLGRAWHLKASRSEARDVFKQANKRAGGKLVGLQAAFFCDFLIDIGKSEQAFQLAKRGATTKWDRDNAFCHLAQAEAILRPHRLLVLSGKYSCAEDDLRTASDAIDEALRGLKKSMRQDEIPYAFLTRAWLRFLKGDAEGVRADLDEAWEIAGRGPMRLHMADIHLDRARFFFRAQPYPWTSPQADLAAARQLIESCGYGRRKEELEDAEKVIGG